MSRPTYLQLEKLVQFLEDNPGIAKGYVRSSHARQQTKLKWEHLGLILNSMGGAIKDAKAWAKFWADKKYALKKIVAQRNESSRRTGGGVEIIQPLSDIEERLVSLMGGPRFAEGDQELSVPLGVPLEPEEIMPLEEENEVLVILEERPKASTSQSTQPPPSQEAHSSSPRRSTRRPRLRQSQLHLERQRLMRIEEKRVEAELATSAGWAKLVKAIDGLANAIIVSGDKIAQALQNRN